MEKVIASGQPESPLRTISSKDSWKIPRGRFYGIPKRIVEIVVPDTEASEASARDRVLRLRNTRPLLSTFSAARYKVAESWIEKSERHLADLVPGAHGHGGRIDQGFMYLSDEDAAQRDAEHIEAINQQLELPEINIYLAFDFSRHPRHSREVGLAKLNRFVLDSDVERPHGIYPVITGKSGEPALLPRPYQETWPYVEVPRTTEE